MRAVKNAKNVMELEGIEVLDRNDFDQLAKVLIASSAAAELLKKHREVEGDRPYSSEEVDADFWLALSQSMHSTLRRKVRDLEAKGDYKKENKDGTRYRYHSTFDGVGFWMPEEAWAEHGMRDFETAEEGMAWTNGLPANFFEGDD